LRNNKNTEIVKKLSICFSILKFSRNYQNCIFFFNFEFFKKLLKFYFFSILKFSRNYQNCIWFAILFSQFWDFQKNFHFFSIFWDTLGYAILQLWLESSVSFNIICSSLTSRPKLRKYSADFGVNRRSSINLGSSPVTTEHIWSIYDLYKIILSWKWKKVQTVI